MGKIPTPDYIEQILIYLIKCVSAWQKTDSQFISQGIVTMNIRATTLAVILGLSVPAIAEISLNTPAIANPEFPSGSYGDGTWEINLWFENNAYHYYGHNVRTGDSLSLSGAQVSGNSKRRVYTWRNGDHRYQVSWQPSDPDYIRLQVFAPNGRQVLNRMLSRIYD